MKIGILFLYFCNQFVFSMIVYSLKYFNSISIHTSISFQSILQSDLCYGLVSCNNPQNVFPKDYMPIFSVVHYTYFGHLPGFLSAVTSGSYQPLCNMASTSNKSEFLSFFVTSDHCGQFHLAISFLQLTQILPTAHTGIVVKISIVS